MKLNRLLLVASIVLWASVFASADVQCASIFGDHMVVQRDAHVPVWGTADAGEEVIVRAGGQTKTTQADSSGKWMVKLDPMQPQDPIAVEISGKNKIELHDVLVGDVWLCSGQSNMEFTLRQADNGSEAIAAAEHPNIRLFTVGHKVSNASVDSVRGKWEACSPDTAPNFTAVGYFFGSNLHKDLGVPIGLIESCWGGTLAEAWTAPAFLEDDADFAPILERGRKYVAEYPAELARFEEAQAKAKAENNAQELRRLRKPASPDANPNLPSVLYNGMIAPLEPFVIKGAIWYQGESNANRGFQYRKLLPAMISSWRKNFGEGDFPFLIVQLPEFGRNNPSGVSDWAELREAQWLTVTRLPHVGVAVAMGLGDPADIHPKKKEEVGRRLALIAEKTVYGKDVIDSGPVYKSMQIDGGAVRLSFDELGGGLETHGQKLEGFTIAGEDKKFVPADAKIDGDVVIVEAQSVTHPVAVRYGWENSPTCTLYNKARLPAAPFRTDDWPISSENAR